MLSSRPRAMGRGTGVRVKPPKKHGADWEETLDKLGSAIEQIQQHRASQLSFEEHYRYGYNLVLNKHGHVLYNRLAELVIKHLESETVQRIVPVFPPSIGSATAQQQPVAGASSSALPNSQVPREAAANIAQEREGQLFLQRLKDVWDDHVNCMKKLRNVLKYMDKSYTQGNALPSTWDLGLSLFLHHVLLYSTSAAAKKAAAAAAAPAVGSSKTPVPSGGRTVSSSSAAPTLPPTADPSCVARFLILTILSQIRIERSGDVVSRSLLKSITEMLTELTDETAVPLPINSSIGTGSGTPVITGVGSSAGGYASVRTKPVMGQGTAGAKESAYRTSFEAAFLAQSKEFYAAESVDALDKLDMPTYLRKVERRLAEEADRAQTYLATSTEAPLIELLEETLITAHIPLILNHQQLGLHQLLDDHRTDDLQRLYKLFGKVALGPNSLRTELARWIVERGKRINEGLLVPVAAAKEAEVPDEDQPMDLKGKGKEKEAPPEKETPGAAKTRAALMWVQNVLDLKVKFDGLLKEAFSGDKAFEKSINDAFIDFVNKCLKAPEYISLFLDENLKKGLKGKSEAEVDQILDRAIALFRFLSEKDVFERYYNQHLSRRLILGRSVSDDAERGMLAKLKTESGSQFTKSAEGMMKDVRTSEDLMPEYKRYQNRAGAIVSPFDMRPIICSQNFWTLPNNGYVAILPPILTQGAESFKAFYNTKHDGRKLTYRTDHGNVDIRTKFANRSHEINVSTHAACVLLLFEKVGDSSLTYPEIAEATGIGATELRRTLQSIACGKWKILLKSPKGREVNDGDTFVFNDGFVCNLAKIKIQTVANKVENSEETRATNEKVDEDRKHMTEACIVRVMKDRKAMLHSELVSDVVSQLSSRFQPQPQKIKLAIEGLIEKEYLERDPVERKRLLYLA